MSIASLPWQAIALLFVLVSLLSFSPLMWVRASLPSHSAALLLALLTPTLLVVALLLYIPLYQTMYVEHQHLNNALNGFLVTLVPALTALGAWVLSIIDVVRRRAWGWVAPVALVPYLGALVYGFAGGRAKPDTRLDREKVGLGALLLVGATLALLCVIGAIFVVVAGTDGRHCGCSTPSMFALFDAGVAVITGVCAGLALLVSRPAQAVVLLILTAVVAGQIITGTKFPVQDLMAPTSPPNVVVDVYGIPNTESMGVSVTLAVTAVLALLQLRLASRLAPRPSQ